MTTEYSISVDDWNDPKWIHHGINVMREYYEENEQGIAEIKELADDCACDPEELVHEKADESFPMMLYAYPIYNDPSDQEILEVCLETCCTVVEDNDTGDCYLALCGGGMDLSQDIALAYVLVQGWVPASLALEVCTQYGLSKSGDKWRKAMVACEKALRNYASSYLAKADEIAVKLDKQEEVK
jgi:hypothetical protein